MQVNTITSSVPPSPREKALVREASDIKKQSLAGCARIGSRRFPRTKRFDRTARLGRPMVAPTPIGKSRAELIKMCRGVQCTPADREPLFSYSKTACPDSAARATNGRPYTYREKSRRTYKNV